MPELFFDTETTGIFPRNANPIDLEAFSKSRMVSIAWTLKDENTVYSQHYYIVKNEITEGEISASHIHGIDREMVNKYGQDVMSVLETFMADCEASDMIIAHNLDFDIKIIKSELYRLGLSAEVEYIKNKSKLCTMKSTTEFVGIKTHYGYKWPKLIELHNRLFGKDFENAHNALADVNATVDCYYELLRIGYIFKCF